MNRSIHRIVQGVQTIDGAGVNLKRIIGSQNLDMLDPFLLLDEFGSNNPDDYLAGFPSHPHRVLKRLPICLMESSDIKIRRGMWDI